MVSKNEQNFNDFCAELRVYEVEDTTCPLI